MVAEFPVLRRRSCCEHRNVRSADKNFSAQCVKGLLVRNRWQPFRLIVNQPQRCRPVRAGLSVDRLTAEHSLGRLTRMNLHGIAATEEIPE